MKKVKFVGLGLIVCLIVPLFALLSSATAFAANANETRIDIVSVECVTREIFGDIEIKSTEYLYGFNDSPDFIYVGFADYGYAIYFKETMELMEYSLIGSLPYSVREAQKYYAGPSNYFERNGESFINAMSGQRLSLSRYEAALYSQ